MRRALRILAIVLCVIGAVWIGQGLGFVPGSFMTGQRAWAVSGAGVLAVGLLLAWCMRRTPRGPRA